MEELLRTIYLLCATVGGTILVIQTFLLALGFGADTDADVDAGDLHDAGQAHAGHYHDGESFLQILSFKTVVAFLTFFGLGGLASLQGGFSPFPTLAVSLCAGALALYIVAYLMRGMSRLQSKGNLDLRNAVGGTAQVYLRVPGKRSGQGKVLVAVQGRKVECKAITEGLEISTGSAVRVVGVSAPDTLEVLPL